ncbi:MAG: hypothetical protein IPM26_04335 [Saprospiraceae bacterium]|nr:hypothetical protein [Saprospiraceae bacterium]
MKKWLGILLVLALAGGVIGYKMYNKPHKDLSSASPDYVLFPSTLVNEYEEDEDAANAKYLDKVIELKGKVREISQDGTGNFIMETGNPLSGVQCALLNPEDIRSLSEGATVTVRGICTGKLMDVNLSRCVIIL